MSPATATAAGGGNREAVTLLAAAGLSKSYRGRAVVSGVEFSVEAGQICALLGPNGAGKTTTMRMLVGLSRPDTGTATLLGEPARLEGAALRGS